MSGDERVEAGKRWAGGIFEQAREAYKDSIVVEIWSWKNDWPVPSAYVIQFQIKGSDDIYYIPSENRGFSRGQISDCGSPVPVNDPRRKDVRDTIYWKFDSLTTNPS